MPIAQRFVIICFFVNLKNSVGIPGYFSQPRMKKLRKKMTPTIIRVKLPAVRVGFSS